MEREGADIPPRLIVEIIGDASQLNRTFRQTSRDAARFDARISGVGRSVARVGAGFFGTYGLIMGIKGSVSAASNLNEQMAKTEVVFGQSAAGIKEWSRSSAQSLGLARDEALQVASSFGALLRPLGIAGDEAVRQSEQLTQLGADLASFYNTDVASALEAIRSGLVGESEPLRRYGALLSETRVQQEALNATGKDNAKQLTETDKVLARIALTFKDTAVAQGNFAATSDEAANNLRTLQANVRNTAADIGGKLLPVLNEVAGAINAAFKTSPIPFDQLARLQEAGVFDLGRRLDAIEGARGQRGPRFGAVDKGLVGGATAGRRASAALTEAQNRATLRQNQLFDARINRQLDRVQDITSVRGQIDRLREIGAEITKRIAATKDVTRRLNLEDQALAVQRDIRFRQADLAAAAEDAIRDREEKARRAAEKARRAREKAAREQRQAQERLRRQFDEQFGFRAPGRPDIRAATIGAIRELRDRRLAREQAAQFRALGLTSTGDQRAPGARTLLRLSDQLIGRAEPGKLENRVKSIREVITKNFKGMSDDVRRTIRGMLDDIDRQLRDRAGPVGFKQGSPNKLAALLLPGGSAAERRALAAKLSQIGPGGTVRTGRSAAFAGAGATGGIVITGTVNIHGVQNVRELEDNLARRASQRARVRRGAS